VFAAINSVKKLKLTIRRNAPPLSFGLPVSPQDFNPLLFYLSRLTLPRFFWENWGSVKFC